ncbi:MAG: tetratricopeptide repeat protein [Acidobacteriota bacterium]
MRLQFAEPSRGFVSSRCVLCRGLVGWVLMLIVCVGEARAADPFYEQLMDDGVTAHRRGDFVASVRDLHLACFGLLEEPVVLTRCLAFLAVSQAEIGDVPGFNKTFGRILAAERVAGAFSKLDLEADVRSALELHVEQWIPIATLDRVPVFQRVARRKQATEIRQMGPEEARLVLERLIIGEPSHAPWRLLLAEVELTAGDPASARLAAQAVLDQEPGLAAAVCLRGKANAALGDCASVLQDLDACDGSEPPNRQAEIRIRCHISLEEWDAAEVLLAGLSADERQSSPFRQLARQIRKGRKAAARSAASGSSEDGVSLEDSTTLEDGVPLDGPGEEGLVQVGEAQSEVNAGIESQNTVSPAGESGAEASVEGASDLPDEVADRVRQELADARALLAGGTRTELELAFREIRELADLYPGLVESRVLTAEIAYRLSRWGDAVTHFRRAREGAPLQPEHQFYLAVSLYESGELTEARETLRLCLDRLERTDFVARYSAKINQDAAQ